MNHNSRQNPLLISENVLKGAQGLSLNQRGHGFLSLKTSTGHRYWVRSVPKGKGKEKLVPANKGQESPSVFSFRSKIGAVLRTVEISLD